MFDGCDLLRAIHAGNEKRLFAGSSGNLGSLRCVVGVLAFVVGVVVLGAHGKHGKERGYMPALPIVRGVSLVSASAGVFCEIAAGAHGKVKGEFLDDALCVRSGLNLHDDREVISFGNRLLRNQTSIGFGEGHLDGGGTISSGDGDDLFGGCDHFAIFDKGDLNFAIRGHKELGMRVNRRDQPSAVRASFFFVVVVAFFGHEWDCR